VRQGANISVAYFDQMRNALDLDATLEDFISPGSEWIEIGNRRQHVKSYLGDFLFSPARANSPVRSLSGGERNRLLLARLFAAPGQRAGARRADQRPGHRHAGAAGRPAAKLRRHGVSGQP
jgi:ATPase subunit of ABC transporter with duplicated ATPase domains